VVSLERATAGSARKGIASLDLRSALTRGPSAAALGLDGAQGGALALPGQESHVETTVRIVTLRAWIAQQLDPPPG
jgi:hypothetical protein